MWKEFFILGFRVLVKVYEKGSHMGLKEFPRISKLEVWQYGKQLANFDRGWDFNNIPADTYHLILKAIDKILLIGGLL